MGGDPRRAGDRPERRLLRPRRRQPRRRPAGGAAPHPVPAGDGHRHLRAPDGSARWRARWTTLERDECPAPRRRADATPRGARAGAAHGAAARPGRPALAERRRGDLDRRRPRRPVGADRVVVVGRGGLAGAVQPGRADRDRRRRRPAAAARRAPRQLPARRLGAPAAVDGRAARRALRRDRRLRRVLDHPLRPRARREGRPGRRPALRAAGHRHAQARPGRGRGTEVDLSGYWLDGDPLHLGPIRIGAGATVGARSTLLPGRPGRQGRRDRRRVHGPRAGPRRPALGGLARAADRQGGGGGRRRGPPRSRLWAAAYGPASLLLGLLPAIAALPALRARRGGGRGHGVARRRRSARALLMVAPATLAFLVDVRGARAGRRCGCSASACPRATTRCTAAPAGRSGPPSG